MVVHRLAAVVSLAFVVSHCAIDDRELEVHDGDDDSGGSSNGGSSSGRGGSSNGGSSSGKGGTSTGGTSTGGTAGTSGIPIACQRDEDDDDCFACQKASCCEEYQACFASDDCLDYVYCGAECGLDPACIAACGIDFPEGETIFLDFTSCGDASCAEVC